MENLPFTLPPDPHFVYMLYSPSHDVYYKGYTKNPKKRLAQHNAGESTYTKNRCPWQLVYLQVFSTQSEALKRERVLKRQNRPFLESLLTHKINVLDTVTCLNSFQKIFRM